MLKRILLTTDAVGGVWRYSMEVARGFAARDIEIVLAVLGPPPGPAQRREAAAIPGLRLFETGLPLDWLAETPDEIDFAANVLAAMARQVDADTVQLHAPALVGDASWPVPVVAVVHSCVGTWWQAVRDGPLPSDLAWRSEATRVGLARADVVVTPSASFAEALRACYRTARPIEVVLNGRTPMSGTGQRRSQALCAGRLWDEGKNIAALDAAAAALAWPVLAAGPDTGPSGARVTFRHLRTLGPLDDACLADEFARAAVFVSVSSYEPFGLAVLEAAQAGCALLLSDIPTFHELWDDAAIFVPPDQPQRIAAELDCLLRDPAAYIQYGKRAFARAACYDSMRMADTTWAIHDRLTARVRTAA
ncbi:glycosyltransferase family 4 protein [Rhodopila sp.]|uniref:glycosyltransferase family 4 protein n=1 Tax=Rhodopila sp. TaxID=2480087 RepID=UPI003D0B0422